MRNHTATTSRRPGSTLSRAVGAVGIAAALALSLAACKDGDAVAMTPVDAALAASAPAVSAAHVPPPPTIATGAATGDLASVQAQLDSTLDKAAACSADTECHAVAVGAKACGGPTGYRAYSDKTIATASVDALAQRQRDLSAQAARESHEVSTCFMLADPGARCEQNKCVTGRRTS